LVFCWSVAHVPSSAPSYQPDRNESQPRAPLWRTWACLCSLGCGHAACDAPPPLSQSCKPVHPGRSGPTRPPSCAGPGGCYTPPPNGVPPLRPADLCHGCPRIWSHPRGVPWCVFPPLPSSGRLALPPCCHPGPARQRTLTPHLFGGRRWRCSALLLFSSTGQPVSQPSPDPRQRRPLSPATRPHPSPPHAPPPVFPPTRQSSARCSPSSTRTAAGPFPPTSLGSS
jgi:hypothetical protein